MNQRKPTLGEQVSTLELRLNDLESKLNSQLPPTFDNVFKRLEALNTAVNYLIDSSNSLIEALDPTTKAAFEAKFNECKNKRVQEKMEREKKILENLVENGKYVATDKVEGESVIVFCQRDKDNNIIGSGREQAHINSFPDVVKEKLMVMAVGDIYSNEEGFSMEIQEVYNPVQEDPPSTELRALGALPPPQQNQ